MRNLTGLNPYLGEDEEGVAEEDCRELEACDKADDGVVLLQPVEADCKSANEEGVEGEERQVGLKRVAVVGNVQKVSTVPPEVSYRVKATRMSQN